MIYMFLSNNPSSGDINSSNLPCFYSLNDGGSRISGKGVHMCKGGRVHVADFISFF